MWEPDQKSLEGQSDLEEPEMRWELGEEKTRGAEEAPLEHLTRQDVPLSAIPVEGTLTHSHISMSL